MRAVAACCLAACLLALLAPALAVPVGARLKRVRLDLKRFSPVYRPETSFEEWVRTGQYAQEDPLEQVRSVIDHLPSEIDTSLLQVETTAEATAEAMRVRSYCEICILIMQMKERGQPHLCAGLNALHYVTVCAALWPVL
jgi:hypothetical protein